MSHRFGSTAYGLASDSKAAVDWRKRATCRSFDAETWFPIGETGPALDQIAEARQVCFRCPVAADCLAWALGKPENEGIWAGMTSTERRIYFTTPTHPDGEKCSKGHLFTAENVYIAPGGKRLCRMCRHLAGRAAYQARVNAGAR